MVVSIIIPHLEDGTNYLQDCLDSISAQAFKDVQLLVEEDDPANPLGVAAMRNRGLKKATGDYVLFMDSDDYLGCEALTGAVFTASMNPGSIVRMTNAVTYYKYATAMALEERDREERAKADASAKQAGIDLLDGPTAYVERPTKLYDTCLGQLIPRLLLEGLQFEENYRYYSDIPFVAGLYERTDIVAAPDSYYYSRRHNDSVQHPALSQEINADRFTEYCNAIRLAAGYMSNPMPLSSYVCEFLVSRTVMHINPRAMGWSDRDLNEFAALVRDVAIPAFTDYSGESKRVLTAFKKGNIRAVKRIVRNHHRREKLRLWKTSRHQRRLLIYNKLFTALPIRKNTVLFSSFFGRAYSDSPRALFEYMAEKYPDKKYVWVLNSEDDAANMARVSGHVRRVTTDSLKYYYYLARAEYYITNVRQPEWYVKRDGAILLQTWHGTPLKRLVFDLEDVFAAQPTEYKKRFYRQACQWDYLISDNAFSSEAFASAFGFPREKMLEMGYPRNDILYAADAAERTRDIKKRLGVPPDKKIVLYAPTWRDDEAVGVGEYGFGLKLELGRLKKLSEKYHFVLRTHYLISEHLELSEDEKAYVTDASKWGDISELYLISDVLITDYSSVFFDFANLGRPILFYVYDYEKYRDVLHGFYFDMNEGCPGPMLRTTAEVAEALEHIDEISEEYKEKYEAFRSRFCYLDDGGASERIIEKIML